MAEAQRYSPDPVMWRDSWNGLRMSSVTVNDSAPDSAAASAELEFYQEKSPTGRPRLSLPATIANAATWDMTIPAQVLPLPPGEWYLRLRVIRADGKPKTYLQGTLRIV
ncbi:hypothetical protein [Luteolibacter marinus]|uniref:hypothetical protein n=1 Tax=Luteolibacter marinus TaxID=2776705 RepID=UPI0018679C70|nr:hypothetical protein [Luteolibacter marinus]